VRTEAEIPSLDSDRISASVSGKLILIIPYQLRIYIKKRLVSPVVFHRTF